MTTPTTLPEALTEIEDLRGQVRELLRLLGQEAPEETGAAGLSTSEITGLNDLPEVSFTQVSFERKQTGREQAQTLAELRNVIETVPDVIFRLDLRGNLAGWNKRLETVTGFVPEELNGRSALSFVPECEHEQTAAAIRRVFEEGYAELEGHLLTKDQRAIPYHWTGAALKSDEGQVIGITGVGRDVSEKKRIEAELRRQQQHFLAAQAMAHVGSWDWDIVSGAMEWSEEQFRIFGYEPREIPTTYGTFLTALHPDDHDRVVAWINDTLEGKTPLGVECRVVRPDGEIRTVHYLGRMVRDEESSPVRLSGSTLDMTDRKQAESALRQSESRFRAMIENSSDIITVLDLDGTIRFESPSFERLLGYAQHEIDGRIAFDFIHPDDLPTVIEKFQRIIQRPGETQTAEFRFRHQDGSWLILEGVGRATCDSQGEACVIVNSRDITERKRAERSLLQTRDLLTSFVENTPAAVAMLDRELRYVAVSRRWLTDYRLGDEPLVGRRHYDVFPEIQDMKEWQEIHQRCLSGSVERREEDRFVRADGSEDWLRWEIRPWHDITGEIGGIIMFTEVITERKKADDALRKSEQRFHFAVEATSDGIWDWDIRTGVVYFSPQWMRLLGYLSDEIVLSTEFFFSVVHPDDRARTAQVLQEHLDGRIPVKQLEIRLRQKSGDYRWYLDRGKVVVRDQDGRPLRMVGTITDITDRKQAEEALRISEERFAKAFNEAAIGMALVAPDGHWLEVNQALCQILDYSKEELQSTTFQALTHPDDLQQSLLLQQRLLRGELQTYQMEKRYLHKEGHTVWAILNVSSVRNHEGQALYQIAQIQDITERKRAERLLEAEKQVLALMATSQPLTDTLTLLCACCESIGHGMLVSVLLLDQDGRHLRHGAAPSLPDAYKRAIDGVAIGPEVGSCGAAAYLGRQVLVADIATDPLWDKYRELALSHGLRSCWSTPIFSEGGQVLGTFAAYYRMPQKPLKADLHLIDRMVHLARLAIERKQAEQALKMSGEKLRQSLQASNTGLWDWNTETNEVRFSREWKMQLGYEEAELPDAFESWESRLHPEDHGRAVAYAQQYRDNPTGDFRQDFRLLHKDGTYRWIDSHASFVTEPDGRRVRLLGSHTDITVRKQMEEALRESEMRYRSVVTAMAEGIVIQDVEGTILSCNISACRILGLTEDQMLGRTSFDPRWRAIHEDGAPFIGATHPAMETLRTGIPCADVVMGVHRPDGSIVWISINTEVVRGSHGSSIHGVVASFRDITERKRAEAELRISQERYARATAVGKVGVWELNVLREQFNADDNLKALFGYSKNELSTDPYVWLNLVHPDDRAITLETWNRVSKGLIEMYSYEVRMIRKDGSIIWTHVRGHAHRNEAGSLVRLIGATVDVTERKQAEEALRRSKFLIDRNADAVYWIDQDGRILDVNEAASLMLGYTMDELCAMTVHDLNPTFTAAMWPGFWAETRQMGSMVLETAHRTKDGRLIPIEVRVNFLAYEGKEYHCAFVRDITERKRAADALRATTQKLEAVIRTSPLAIISLDTEGERVTGWNEAAERLFGWTAEEVIGQPAPFIPDDKREQAYEIWNLLNREEIKDSVELRRRTKDGSLIDLMLWGTTLRGPDGQLQGSVAFLADISERKQSELALKQAQDSLKQTQFSVDHASDGFFWIGPDARILDVNEAACRMLNYTREELTALSIQDLDPNVSAESWAHQWEQLKQKGSMTFESRHWSSTGRVVETEITANYLWYGGKEYNCAIMRDIGERKRAEAELRQSHAFIRQVIDVDPNFIFAKDRDGRFTLVNKAVAECYGTTVDSLIGKSDEDFNSDAEEVAFFRRLDLDVMDTLQERFIPEEKITDSTGRLRWLQTVKRPIFDDQGRAVMVLGAATDITERKRVEAELRQREWDLRAAVEERERISEDLHDGILQSIFAVGLGLESCRTLVSKLPLPRKKMAAPLMGALNSAIGQLNHVMTDVRNFIEGIESQVLQGGDVGSTLRTMAEAMCDSNGTACRVTIEEAAVGELSTEQAYHVMNIVREALSNSLRHSGAGRIVLSFKRLRRSVRLSVTDNGKGFVPDAVRDVGHGLVNMAARARKLGGRVEVRSWPRKGTKVVLDMPRRSADA